MPKIYTKKAYSTTAFHKFIHNRLDMEYTATNAMNIAQAFLSDAVQRFLKDTNTPQTVLADDLGITQGTLSRKLSGVRNWNLKDIDQLMRIGVPVGFETLAAAALSEEGEGR